MKTLKAHLFTAESCPGVSVLLAESSDDLAAPAARCQFSRNSNLVDCASWMEKEVRAWLLQASDEHWSLTIALSRTEAVVEIRCTRIADHYREARREMFKDALAVLEKSAGKDG